MIKFINKILFTQVDNSSLVLFRIFFGFYLFVHSFSSLISGKVKKVFIDPEFTFNFIGFDFLQHISHTGIYTIYITMAILGILISIGYKYKFSLISFTVLMTTTYLLQKSSYNNHYYLMILLCIIMSFFPANNFFSIDALKKPSIKTNSMPQYVLVAIILQMWIVYSFGSINKFYPDWLEGRTINHMMRGKGDFYFGNFLQLKEVQYFISYGGIFYDLLIIPALIYKRTRFIAIIASLVFHISNKFLFGIGIFPYLSLSILLLFYPVQSINEVFFKKKKAYIKNELLIPKNRKLILSLFIIYFSFQILMPLRHWIIKENVLYTEEGHRMSWRMMLRSKSGISTFKVVDKKTGATEIINPKITLTRSQAKSVATRPDMIWQYSQILKKKYANKGKDVAIYVNCDISVNGRPKVTFINPNIDLAAEKWSPFKHHNWIIASDYPK